MASNTKNVKLGVCKILYGGNDLGFTKGGVDVSVETEKYEVNIDQFGVTAINELIQGRDVMVTVPLAETTLENLVAVMPGAVMVQSGGTVASGTITITTNPVAAETILVNGTTVTFRAALTGVGVECLIGGSAAVTGANLAAALNASSDAAISAASYTAVGAVVTVKYGNALIYGLTGSQTVDGNAFTIATGTAAAKVTVSGATLTGGANATSQRVEVSTGTSIDLLEKARELRLHPISKLDADKSEDFVIPLAGTGGGLSFAYKYDEERIFNVEFKGYPDANGKLFYVGT
jgi:hypothetical protein